MEKTVTIQIWRPRIDIPGINGYFSIVGDTEFAPCALVSCESCEGSPGRWEFDPSVANGETAIAVVRDV